MTTPVGDPALVTPEQLASYLQRDLDRSSAELALAGASGSARDYCRWRIAPPETTTFTVDGTGTPIIWLPTLHLSAVADVRLDGTSLTYDSQDGPTVNYNWSTRGHISRNALWPKRFGCIQVDCTHGYDETPDAVMLVVLAVAGRALNNPEGLQSKAVGSIRRTWEKGRPAELSDLECRLLNRYRLP